MKDWLSSLAATPLSMKIGLAFYLLAALVLAGGVMATLSPTGLLLSGPGLRIVAVIAGPMLAGALYALAVLPRMSWWALIVGPALRMIKDFVQEGVASFHIAPGAETRLLIGYSPYLVLVILTLPHWRRLNWSLLGRGQTAD